MRTASPSSENSIPLHTPDLQGDSLSMDYKDEDFALPWETRSSEYGIDLARASEGVPLSHPVFRGAGEGVLAVRVSEPDDRRLADLPVPVPGSRSGLASCRKLHTPSMAARCCASCETAGMDPGSPPERV